MLKIKSQTIGCVGVVLCGGKSSRFGSDKALATRGGLSLAVRAIATLQDAGLEVCLSVGNHSPIYDAKIRHIVDENPDQGPLSGIVSAFRAMPFERLFVLAVDLPFVTGEDVAHLVEKNALGEGFSSLTLSNDTESGRHQPLCGVWHRSLLSDLESYLASGHRAVMPFVERQEVRWVDLPVGHLKNLNEKDDLDQMDW